MSRTRHIEDTLKNFIAYLEAALPARLTTKENYYKTEDQSLYDGSYITLPAFNKYYFGDRVTFPKEFSNVLLAVADRVRPREDLRMKNWRADEFDVIIVLCINISRGTDWAEEWLNKRLVRYTEAISELVEEDHTLDKKVRDAQENDCDWLMIEQKGDVLFKTAVMRFTIIKVF